MEYRHTLNLPDTAFGMKANLAQREPLFLDQWKKENLFGQIRAKSKKSNKTFILHDGPPYANGHIHIGHALNKILKDFIVKYKTMQGFDSLYVPGWDCHGLPIEHQLLKELKTDKSKVECVDFRKKAHDYAMKFVDIQREEFKRLGVFGDWDNPYLTLTPEYEYWILKSLATLTKKGYVYRGLKPVNWCIHCETALAEAEVEYENHSSPSIYVKFKVKNPNVLPGIPGGLPVYLLIWTTTPWTLIANVAVAARPDYQYVLAQVGQEILILESSLAQNVFAKNSLKDVRILKEIPGENLKDLLYTHPFDLRDNCRVVLVDYVTKEEGTGLVHTAPGHGLEDYFAGQKNQLETIMPVDHRGRFTDYAREFAGLNIFQANEKILEKLKTLGLLFYSDQLAHSYPHCWRCKKPIIFRATEQWFLKIDHNKLRDELIQVIDQQVQWIPAAGRERISSMVSLRPDWCLSRQRYWGVPIPAVTCKGCKGQYKLFPEIIESFAESVRKHGTDEWFQKDIKTFIPLGFVCPDCHGTEFEKTNDILDVWFDSGVSHQAVAKAMMKVSLPVDLYLEGSDQHRGWFQSSLIPSVCMDGKAPYKSVLTHGFVVDGQGRKMSKSLGNVVSPQDVVQKYGADILRLWVASSDYNEDIRISKEILDRLIDAYRKIRNTMRFILGNLKGFDPNHNKVVYSQLMDIDQWALYRVCLLQKMVEKSYETYDFASVYKSIHAFCNEDLSSIYLDILKDRLYTSAPQSRERFSAQTVLYEILNILVRISSPLLTFTAQEVFESMPKTKEMEAVCNVHLLDWPDEFSQWANMDIDKKLKKILEEYRPLVLKSLEDKRQSGGIGSSLDAKVIFETCLPQELKSLEGLKDLLPSFFIVSQVEVREGQEPLSIIVEKADGHKCGRCWNYSVSVGLHQDHPTLCEKCFPIVKEIGNAK